ncbi:ubiquitin carboxyl-terminal hydrolase 5-like [Haliotis rufescens]|uniref:ubiquitin carboxyl-terminal hydrolase 5-like n=1 Tax=Haliotis rufescens TaxID=6454 RepID=UPI00201F5114|nr:ubiquitin carboxyl-terminal hydrolase 5-like [Haliotis rufescens]
MTSEMAMEQLKQHLSKIRSPGGGEKVYKDECAYSFDNPESEDGLYVCMNTFLGVGKKHLMRHYNKTGNAVFLRIKRIRIEIPQTEEAEPQVKPTKLAIGVEGGFQVDEKKFRFEETTSVVVMPNHLEIAVPNPDLPDAVQISVATILMAEDAWKLEEAAAMAGTWDGEIRQKSRHADDLLQLDTGRKIPPSGWKCERCDLTTNLWLNLTDGSILCGRKFFDGSGGNNHAVDHFAECKYPLAVKLGTITPDGADVYSYDEDDMVLDPHLTKHLAHFGINITAMQKTEKTMLELEIDLNQKIGEWDVIQEAGSKLTPMYGPGYTGMRNLGNSCYMNSLMQVVMTIPDFQQRYYAKEEDIFQSAPSIPVGDFNAQMAKLAHGLLSGDYSKPPVDGESSTQLVPPPTGIRPQMFKTLVGRGHPEFSTKRQQDAQEFFLHILTFIERNSRGHVNPAECFRFEIEDKVKCGGSGKVKYTTREDYCLALPVPMEAATNIEEVAAYEARKKELEEKKETIDPKSIVRPRISLSACLEAFSAVEVIDDFYSSALKAKTQAHKTTRLRTFPDYLFVQMKKFTIGEDWVPKKLDVSLGMPDDLDISALRGEGLRAGEEELPQEQAPQPAIEIDEATVGQLMEMGFDPNGCRKAVYNTKNTGVEAAMNWVMEHMGDADFAAPLVLPNSAAAGGGQFTPNEESLVMIMSMGFTRDQAVKALKATNNNVERAADWIFSHADELDQPMETDQAQAAAPATPKFRDGSGKYQLVAFISHMGTSTNVGHYVCHILKDGKWVIYNDEKVAQSENPPKDLAYLYLYRRC